MRDPPAPGFQVVRLTFEGPTAAISNRAAQEFLSRLRVGSREFPEESARLIKETPDTQDAGSTLLLVLGSAAIVQLARGLRDLIPKLASRFRLTTEDGVTVIASGDAATNIDMARLVEAIKEVKTSAGRLAPRER